MEALTLKSDQQKRIRTTQRKMVRMVLCAKRRRIEASSGDSDIAGSAHTDEHDEMEPWSEFLKRTAKDVEERLEAAGQEEWLVAWQRRRWRWASKVVQNEKKWCYTALLWHPLLHTKQGGIRAQARPRKRWHQDFEKFCQENGETEPWQEIARCVNKWRSLESNFVEWAMP
jgi:hypothetical protein